METALGYAMNAKPGPRKIIKRGRGGRQHNQSCLYKMEEMVLWLNDHLSGAVMGQSITINPSMPSVRGRGLITLILKKATQQRTARLLHQEKMHQKCNWNSSGKMLLELLLWTFVPCIPTEVNIKKICCYEIKMVHVNSTAELP